MQDTKKIENRIFEQESQIKDILDKSNESQTVLKTIEDVIPNVDQEIIQTEAVKYHVCYVNYLFFNFMNLELFASKFNTVITRKSSVIYRIYKR